MLNTASRRPNRARRRLGAVVLSGRRVGGQRAALDRERGEGHAHDPHRDAAARLTLAVGAVATA